MTEQSVQSDTLAAFATLSGESLRELAAAIHDLASSIRESASFAQLLELEPCDELNGDCDDSDTGPEAATPTDGDSCGGGTDVEVENGDRAGGTSEATIVDGPDDSTDAGRAAETGAAAGDSRVPLQLIPAPHGEAEEHGTEPWQPDAPCRPGGCHCDEPDTGQGRHARREPTLVRPAVTSRADAHAAVTCCQNVSTSAR